jgi:hypothetical protein
VADVLRRDLFAPGHGPDIFTFSAALLCGAAADASPLAPNFA